MAEKVLLLHGPLNSAGIDPVTQHFPVEERARCSVNFNAEATTRASAMAFRAKGFKIVYSGWLEDAQWLQNNAALFDATVLSDQSGLNEEFIFHGQKSVNNKGKLYFGVLRGLETTQSAFGDEGIVFRLRSDVTVNPELAIGEFQRVHPKSGILLIEYLTMNKNFHVPDFMQVAEVGSLLAIYRHLHQLNVSGSSYHISSHVDHCLTYLRMVELGHLKEIHCMDRPIYDAVVWRGIPRYLEAATAPQGYDKIMFFTGKVEMPPGSSVESILEVMKPG